METVMLILGHAWVFLNSPVGITVVGSIALFAMNRAITAKPAWKRYLDQYAGTFVAAIKWAEKAVPDDCQDKSVRRLDAALKYFLVVYTQTTGKTPTPALELIIKEALQVKHAELEAGPEIL
jgi:hypothetical protein